MTPYIPYFSEEELRCPRTGKIELQGGKEGFGADLVALREAYGRPMIVTSCCRSKEHNEFVRGHPRSLHMIDNPYWKTDTLALDIARNIAGSVLAELVRKAQDLDWSIGIARTFIHLDQRTKYVGLPPVIYTYN